MKIAHLILAHTQPDQLQRLVKRLHHMDADFYIHLDAKADMAAFDFLKKVKGVRFVQNRVRVTRGTYSMVRATLNGFEEIAGSGISYGYVNLLSGQDYPLTSPHFLHQYFAVHSGKLFMDYVPVYNEWTAAIPRIASYHLSDFTFPGRQYAEQFLNKALPLRKLPLNLRPAGHSQWFTITLEAVKYILSYLHHHHRVASFFRLTEKPEEMIFQTILYNSPFAKDMVNNNLRYIDRGIAGASPKTLTAEDIPALEESGCLFARKVNIHTDINVLNTIDLASSLSVVA